MTRRFAADGIRANAIAPGSLDTLDATRVPRRRLGRPDEIATYYLASPSGSWIAGQVIRPNGDTLIG